MTAYQYGDVEWVESVKSLRFVSMIGLVGLTGEEARRARTASSAQPSATQANEWTVGISPSTRPSMGWLAVAWALAALLAAGAADAGSRARITALAPEGSVPGDQFGAAVTLAESAELLVVGNPHDDDLGPESGAAFVYERDGDEWSFAAKLVPSDPAPLGRFAWDVAVAGDVIAAGSRRRAYVFARPAEGWSGVLTESARLVPSDASQFGLTTRLGPIAIADGHVAAGGGSRLDGYVFAEPPGGWEGDVTERARLVVSSGPAATAIAFDGETLVIGQQNDSGLGGKDPGAAYVFTRPPGGWVGSIGESALLSPSDRRDDHRFGASVALSDSRIAVGALLDSDGGFQGGAAYVFERPVSGWDGVVEEVAKLVASDPEPGDFLGTTVSMSGPTIVVSAPGADDRGSQTGALYVFTEPFGGWRGRVIESQRLLGEGVGSSNLFGTRVAFAADVVAAGAPSRGPGSSGFRPAGAMLLYQRLDPAAGGSRTQDLTLHAPSREENGGGPSPAPIAGDAELGDLFGEAVAVSSKLLVIGAPADDQGNMNSGSAYVFTRALPTAPWRFGAKLVPSDGAVPNDSLRGFGSDVAIEGRTVFVSSPGAEAVYVYERPRSGWHGLLTENGQLIPPETEGGFGASLDVVRTIAVVGAPRGGEGGLAYLFMRPRKRWEGEISPRARLLHREPAADGRFGASVAIGRSRSFLTVAVGAPGPPARRADAPGRAFVYQLATRARGDLLESGALVPNDSSVGDLFGIAVDVDGTTVAVGANFAPGRGAPSQPGSVYVFERPRRGWRRTVSNVARLSVADALEGLFFGGAVSIDGGSIAVGRGTTVRPISTPDRAWVFHASPLGWRGDFTEPRVVEPEGVTDRAEQAFGASVALSDGTLAVGAPDAPVSGGEPFITNSGAAYVFELETDNRSRSGARWGAASGAEGPSGRALGTSPSPY